MPSVYLVKIENGKVVVPTFDGGGFRESVAR